MTFFKDPTTESTKDPTTTESTESKTDQQQQNESNIKEKEEIEKEEIQHSSLKSVPIGFHSKSKTEKVEIQPLMPEDYILDPVCCKFNVRRKTNKKKKKN